MDLDEIALRYSMSFLHSFRIYFRPRFCVFVWLCVCPSARASVCARFVYGWLWFSNQTYTTAYTHTDSGTHTHKVLSYIFFFIYMYMKINFLVSTTTASSSFSFFPFFSLLLFSILFFSDYFFAFLVTSLFARFSSRLFPFYFFLKKNAFATRLNLRFR